MLIRFGCEITYTFPKPTPMILMLNVHYSRASDLIIPDHVVLNPPVPIAAYRDSFGNWCSRLVAPTGEINIKTAGLLNDSGLPEQVDVTAKQHPVEQLPAEILIYLLGSRYCETDLLNETAWDLFGRFPAGYQCVQAICDYVHQHITFGYEYACPTQTALETFNKKTGVCRDYTHLAITFCRCMNIPARYCTSYLSDIGVPASDTAMDFSASFEAFLGGRWHIFDPRNNQPRIGRILIAQGRDAADVPISNVFGPNTLIKFQVLTDLSS